MGRLFKNIVSKTSSSFFLLFASVFTFAQETPVQEQDSTKTGYSVGQIAMPNPKSIIDAYTYDPVTNKYIYTASVDGFNINYPLILTPEEYEKLVRKETMRKYFQEKLNAYKELLGMAKTTFSKYFDIVDKVQFFARDEKQWDKKFDKFLPNHF